MGLSEPESGSSHTRLEHECTHYFTRRLFDLMRNNMHDELIADYRHCSCYGHRADWFLRFWSRFQITGGQAANYRGRHFQIEF